MTAVITCMTDAERPFIAAALDSVRRQTIRVPAVLCVRDDNAWIDELLAAYDARDLTVLRLPLQPLGVVRNAALTQVTTELVAFLDGDDAWHPEKTARQVALLRRHRLDLIGAKHTLIREDGRSYFFAFARDIPMPSSWLGRVDLFRERPFSSTSLGEDVQLWVELKQAYRVGLAPDFLLRYRVRSGSLSHATPSMRRKLRYEQRSHTPGMRPALLTASWTANVAIEARRRWSTDPTGVARVR